MFFWATIMEHLGIWLGVIILKIDQEEKLYRDSESISKRKWIDNRFYSEELMRKILIIYIQHNCIHDENYWFLILAIWFLHCTKLGFCTPGEAVMKELEEGRGVLLIGATSCTMSMSSNMATISMLKKQKW